MDDVVLDINKIKQRFFDTYDLWRLKMADEWASFDSRSTAWDDYVEARELWLSLWGKQRQYPPQRTRTK